MRFLIGGVFIIAGLSLIVFHKTVKRFNDAFKKHDPLLRSGNWWTGKYTRGGLIFTYASIIIGGILMLLFGLMILLRGLD